MQRLNVDLKSKFSSYLFSKRCMEQFRAWNVQMRPEDAVCVSTCHADMTSRAFLHVFCFMHTPSVCCPASGIPPGLSSLLHFSSSLPPRRSSVHLILFPPPPLRDETICHSLPSHCQMMDNSVTVLICCFCFFFKPVTRRTTLWWPRLRCFHDRGWQQKKLLRVKLEPA